MNWTDEELTELECVIDTYCRESAANGRPVRALGSLWCPLYAVAGDTDTAMGMAKLGLVRGSEDDGFWLGFDGSVCEDGYGSVLHAMGRRFRERTLAGEYESLD